MIIRPLADGELDLFLTLDGPAFNPSGRDFLATAAERHYRPGWTWVAQRGGRVVARAAWWGAPDDDHPIALDWFDLGPDPDRIAVAAALLRAALEVVRTVDGDPPDYHLFLPPDWRDRPEVRSSAEERIEAAGRAGLRPFVERLRYQWAPSSGLPARSARVTFSPVPGDDVLLEVLERINHGTLDAHTRRDLERDGARQAARVQLDQLLWMPAPRDWWRLAYTPGGELVGVVMPTRNHESPVIGCLGVVPEQRGHGYAGDLLAEATVFLAEQGAERILADTDTGNRPMAAAFERTGYRVTGARIVLA